MDKTKRLQSLLQQSALGLVSALSLVASPLFVSPAQAEGSSNAGFEFRWENNRDFRKLYYYTSSARSSARADYYLILGPKDRKTALIKLAVSVPEYFNAQIQPENVELCRMERGGALKKTRCLEVIPAVVEVTGNGTAVEVFPEAGSDRGQHRPAYADLQPGFRDVSVQRPWAGSGGRAGLWISRQLGHRGLS